MKLSVVVNILLVIIPNGVISVPYGNNTVTGNNYRNNARGSIGNMERADNSGQNNAGRFGVINRKKVNARRVSRDKNLSLELRDENESHTRTIPCDGMCELKGAVEWVAKLVAGLAQYVMQPTA
jgi:hypothetical protein